MLLGQAVAETTGLYGLLVAILLLFVKPLVPKPSGFSGEECLNIRIERRLTDGTEVV